MMQPRIKDRTVKAIFIPLFGVIIPNITGMMHNGRYDFTGLLASYLYFILVALLVWEGNVQLMYLIKSRIANQFGNYYNLIASLVFANIIYSGILSFLLFYLWKKWSNESFTGWAPIGYASGIIIISAIFITNIYEIIFLNHEKEYNISRVDQLNISKAHAELEAFKNQIDPHFIFNSLNTLSFLITREPNHAKLFNDTLAKVYRYILINKDKDLVMLKEEIEFICNYFYLMKIRFGEAINLEIEINNFSSDNFLIPPISLQALVENAIKHNDFSDATPLTIYITVLSDYILVKNALFPKVFPQPGQKSGLINLGFRFQMITKRNVIIEHKNNMFSVRLPTLKL
jgi:hypothetical protein